MSFMDKLKTLTQPYDDDDDFFEGADLSSQKQAAPSVTAAQMEFEDSFGASAASAPAPAPDKDNSVASTPSLFGSFGAKKEKSSFKAPRFRAPEQTGSDGQVILFSPKNFDEAGDLVNYLMQGRSVVMTLEGLPTDTARRLLDFLSGITFALQGKITPVSAKTYFVSPQNVDLLNAQPEAPSDTENYF